MGIKSRVCSCRFTADGSAQRSLQGSRQRHSHQSRLETVLQRPFEGRKSFPTLFFFFFGSFPFVELHPVAQISRSSMLASAAAGGEMLPGSSILSLLSTILSPWNNQAGFEFTCLAVCDPGWELVFRSSKVRQAGLASPRGGAYCWR